MAMKPGNLISRIASELTAKNKEQSRSTPTANSGAPAAARRVESVKQLQADAYDYFTVPGPTALLYSAERYAMVTLTLRTPGPVAVGTRANLTPVNSGKGVRLVTDEPFVIKLDQGTRLYVVSGAVSRVSVVIDLIPATSDIGLERQVVALLTELNSNIKAMRSTR